MRNLYTFLFLFFLTFHVFGQKLPSTHLYLFDFYPDGNEYKIANPKWLNQFNPKGYNNQPYFMNDDELYVSVQMPWDTTQTDIYSLNLATYEFGAVTNTPESEYSPKPVPNSQDFSVVRVDANAQKVQRLWRYPLNRKNKGAEVFKYHQGVGYYHWISPEKVLMFMVGQPNYYQLTTLPSESNVRFPYAPGRCFQATNDGKVAYIEKTNEDDWVIKKMETTNYGSDVVMPTLNQSEDFVILKDGTYLMGKGSGLYKFTPKKDQEWQLVSDLRIYGIRKIERMAINNTGKLVMVTK